MEIQLILKEIISINQNSYNAMALGTHGSVKKTKECIMLLTKDLKLKAILKYQVMF